MKRSYLVVVLALVVGMVAGLSVMALAGGARQQKVSRTSPQLSGVTLKNAGTISHVTVVRSNNNDTLGTTTLSAVPGMAANVVVPTGHSALLLIRFSSESACYGGGAADNWCYVEVLVDGHVAVPGGIDYAFDSTNTGADGSASWESLSQDQSIQVGAGTHHVAVWAAVLTSGVTFWLGQKNLTIERALI